MELIKILSQFSTANRARNVIGRCAEYFLYSSFRNIFHNPRIIERIVVYVLGLHPGLELEAE